jgi:ribonuclease P protein component
VAVRFVPDVTTDRVRVAYAIGKRYGGAVERNRCRRRLRAVLRELVAELPPGAYLVGVGPGGNGLAFGELRERVFEAVRRASKEASR